MKVKVKEWNAVASWHWDLKDLSDVSELCGICRVAFEGTCPSCKYPGTECPIILGGGCTHNFHLHCILKWLEQDTSKGLCPMCRRVFTYKKEHDNKTIPSIQVLIDGHRAMREQTNDEFESYDDDIRMGER